MDMKEKVEYMGLMLWRVKPSTPLHTMALQFLHIKFGTLRDGGKIPPFFPGPQPVSIERRHFPILKSNDYVVCEKTDGVRHVLLSFKFEAKKMVIMVNRNLDFYIVPIRMQTIDAVLDGELVRTHDGKMLYMVYDAVVPMTFPGRYEFARDVTNKILKLSSDPFKVQLKTFYAMNQFSTFIEQKYPYETDGFVFTPVNELIKIGTHETMFKWKPLMQNTIDFQLKKRPNVEHWGLYIQDHGVLVYECEIPFDPMYEEDQIVECMFVKNDYTWTPLKVRPDKNYPNARRTYYRTMINLREDIQIEEFM